MTPTREHIDALTTTIPEPGPEQDALVERQQEAILQLLPDKVTVQGAVPGTRVAFTRHEEDRKQFYLSKRCRVPFTDKDGTPAPRGFFARRTLHVSSGAVKFTVEGRQPHMLIIPPWRHKDQDTRATWAALEWALLYNASTDPQMKRTVLLLAVLEALRPVFYGGPFVEFANHDLVKLAPWLIAKDDNHRSILTEVAKGWDYNVGDFAAAAAAAA